MKKILSVSLTLLMLLGLFSGCAANAGNIRDDKKISVVATIFPQYDFTREIAGEYADISMLLSPGAEAHSYEPTPQDIIKIQNCDLFIYVGGESDAWIADILDSLDLENTKVISLMDIVDVVEEETVEGMEAEHEHEHEGKREKKRTPTSMNMRGSGRRSARRGDRIRRARLDVPPKRHAHHAGDLG
jgi:zinc transport system substrate-binding protein